MNKEMIKLKRYLEECHKDCIKLKKHGYLTQEGEGQLAIIEAIYEHMGWIRNLRKRSRKGIYKHKSSNKQEEINGK